MEQVRQLGQGTDLAEMRLRVERWSKVYGNTENGCGASLWGVFFDGAEPCPVCLPLRADLQALLLQSSSSLPGTLGLAQVRKLFTRSSFVLLFESPPNHQHPSVEKSRCCYENECCRFMILFPLFNWIFHNLLPYCFPLTHNACFCLILACIWKNLLYIFIHSVLT